MPELQHFLQVVMNALTHNVWVQGAAASLAVAVLRRVFKGLDAKAKDPSQVKIVQGIVALLCILTQVLQAYAAGHLGGLDPSTLVNTVQVALVALGVHQFGKDFKSTPIVHTAIEATKAKVAAVVKK